MNRSREVFDERSAFYDHLTWVNDASFATAIEALFYPRLFRRALDLACGTGSLTKTLASHAVWTCAVDVSLRMLRLAIDKPVSTGRDRIAWILADGERLPFERQNFNLIVCRNGLHHFANPSAGLEEIRRILDTDGQFVLVEPVAPSAAVKYEWSEAFRMRDKGRHPRFYFTEDELVSYLADHDYAASQRESLRITQRLDNWLNTGSLSAEEMAKVHDFLTMLPPETKSSLGVTSIAEDWVINHKWALLSLVPA